jgi:hypothetical protein
MKIDQTILMWLIDRWDTISTTVGTIEVRVSLLISNLSILRKPKTLLHPANRLVTLFSKIFSGFPLESTL